MWLPNARAARDTDAGALTFNGNGEERSVRCLVADVKVKARLQRVRAAAAMVCAMPECNAAQLQGSKVERYRVTMYYENMLQNMLHTAFVVLGRKCCVQT